MITDNLKNLIEQYHALERISNNRITSEMRELSYKIFYDVTNYSNLTENEYKLLDGIVVDMHILTKLYNELFNLKKQTKSDRLVNKQE